MAVTYSATPLAKYRSKLSNSLVSIAAAGTETITLNHRLGASPDEVRPQLRSMVSAGASAILAEVGVASYNASQVTLTFGGATAAAQSRTVDIVCEITYSTNR